MWVVDQITGYFRNLWGLVAGFELGELFPPFVVGLLIWTRDTLPRALGFSARDDHITGVIAFTLVLVISSLGILTTVAIYFFIVFWPIALLRLVPAVEARWPFDAASWPLWTVQEEGFDSGEVA